MNTNTMNRTIIIASHNAAGATNATKRIKGTIAATGDVVQAHGSVVVATTVEVNHLWEDLMADGFDHADVSVLPVAS